MGILGNLIDKVGKSKVGQSVFKPGGAVDKLTKPVQLVGAIVANPVTAVTKGVSAALDKSRNESFEKQAGKVLVNTGTVAAAVLTGGTSTGRTVATTVIKALTPTTAKGALTLAIAAPVTVGVLKETKKPLDVIVKAPGALTAFGSDVGKAIEDPSLSSITNIVKENPTVSAVVGGLAIGAGAGALVSGLGAIENIKTRESVQDLTQQLSIMPVSPAPSTVGATPPAAKTEQKPFSPTTAVTPATAPLSSTNGTRARKKRTTKKVQPSVNQRVNVIVQNKNTSTGIRATNKNYLKRSILA